MARCDKFYSSFYTRNSFLSHSSSGLYTQASYLESQGFNAGFNFRDKTVVELGAGTGGLTLVLAEGGILQTAKRYIVVEPSHGIANIKQQLNAPNVVFVNSDLTELSASIEPRSVDYFIASGVIPHIEARSLSDVLGRIAPFVAPSGSLHIVSSFYGFEKRIARRLKAICRTHPRLIPICAAFSAMLQGLLRHAPDGAGRSMFVRNFIYSFQTSLKQIYLQQKEFYAVEPYSIFWNYQDYVKALAANGFAIDCVFPHPIALRESRGSVAGGFSPTLAGGADVTILGSDWVGRWFASELNHPRQRIVESIDSAKNADVIVIAYDYTRGRPYYEVTADLSKHGYVLGRNLFLFQMLL